MIFRKRVNESILFKPNHSRDCNSSNVGSHDVICIMQFFCAIMLKPKRLIASSERAFSLFQRGC